MTTETIPYEPETWNDDQRLFHEPANLDEALHHASCLAGGWYRRPVTIWMYVTDDLHERYRLAPSDVALSAPWDRRVYTVTSHSA